VTFENAVQDLIQKGLVSREDGLSFLRRRSGGKQLTPSTANATRLTSPAIN
jgi:hypothetical protein